MIIKILLRNALACALVLTTFNACQASEENMTIGNDGYNTVYNNDDLSKAKAKLSELTQILHDNQNKQPEDNIQILQKSNMYFSDVEQIMQNLVRGTVEQPRILTTKSILKQAIEYCFKPLAQLQSQLNEELRKPNLDYVTQQQLKYETTKLYNVEQKCLEIVCHLIKYR